MRGSRWALTGVSLGPQQKRKLRLYISNTFNPAKSDADDSDGSIASWELRVEGKLLDDVRQSRGGGGVMGNRGRGPQRWQVQGRGSMKAGWLWGGQEGKELRPWGSLVC